MYFYGPYKKRQILGVHVPYKFLEREIPLLSPIIGTSLWAKIKFVGVQQSENVSH